MPNISSAKKRLRQTAKRTAVNRDRKSRMRNSVRSVEDAIRSGDVDAARNALKAAEPIIARCGQRGTVHRNMARRKVSRLALRINAMAQAGADT